MRSIRFLVFFCLFLIIALTILYGFTMDANNYCNRGNAYLKKGLYNQAISDFNKALKINPKFAEVYFNQGLAYAKKVLYDQAISDYNKALEINPKFARAYYNKAISCKKQVVTKKLWKHIRDLFSVLLPNMLL